MASTVLFVLLSIAMVTAIYQRQLNLRLNLFEDSPRLASASALLAGRMPFRDFTVHYGILQEVLRPWIAFRIWGATYEAYLRAGAWLSAATGLGMLLLIAQVLRHRWWCWIAAIILICRSDLYVPDRLFFAVFAVLFYCRALMTRRVIWSVAAGIGVVCCLLYSLEIGVTLIAAMTAYGCLSWGAGHRASVAPKRGSPHLMLYAVLGTLSAAASILVYAAVAGALKPFFVDNIALLTHYSASWSDGLPSRLYAYWFLKHHQPWALYLYIQQIPFLSLAIVAYLLGPGWTHRQTARWQQALLLACIVFFEFFIYIGRSDYAHWLNATPFAWPLAAMALEEIFDVAYCSMGTLKQRFSAVFSGALLACPFLAVLCGLNPLWLRIANQWLAPAVAQYDTPEPDAKRIRRLGKIAATPAELSEMVEVVRLIQTHVAPGETFFDLSNHGGLYFLAERENATSFGMVNEVQGPAMVARCLDELRRHPPKVVLAKAPGGVIQCPLNALPIRDYLLSRFHVGFRTTTGDWLLLVPNSTPAMR
jgi:hypothetical protein